MSTKKIEIRVQGKTKIHALDSVSSKWVPIPCQVASGSGTKPGTTKDLGSEETLEKHRLIRERTGTGGLAGSLNLHPQRRVYLDRSMAIELPYGPFWLARIRNVNVVFRPWPVPETSVVPPVRQLLVYSDHHLRDTFGLRDGQIVDLEVPLKNLRRPSAFELLQGATRKIARALKKASRA